jgi:hypothetical protein
VDPVRSVEVCLNAMVPRLNDLVAACAVDFQSPAARIVISLWFNFELSCVVAGRTEVLDIEFVPSCNSTVCASIAAIHW